MDILTVFRGGQARLRGFVAHRLFFERALWDWLPLDIPQFLALCGGHMGQEAACVVPQLVAEDQHTAHSKISVSMDIHKSVRIKSVFFKSNALEGLHISFKNDHCHSTTNEWNSTC